MLVGPEGARLSSLLLRQEGRGPGLLPPAPDGERGAKKKKKEENTKMD